VVISYSSIIPKKQKTNKLKCKNEIGGKKALYNYIENKQI
jgi:hypothetical protein